jgi:inhibitor of KinA
MLDIIVAYSSVSVFYDPAGVRAGAASANSGNAGVSGHSGASANSVTSAADFVEALLMRAWAETVSAGSGPAVERAHSFRIPVCYQGRYAPDLEGLAGQLGLRTQEIIELHFAEVYRVYMIGFLPGFPYLGTVDKRLQVPRKGRPVPVQAGAVGIAGGQTGIYPLNSPGGWSIIGRTPLKLFDPEADPPVRLQTGDRVQFYPISPREFEGLSGRPV